MGISEHHRWGILKKLLLVNLLIIVAFSIVVLSVVLSFRNFGTFSETITDKEVNEVIRNAELGRDLNAVFAESDLFVSTFMNRDEDISLKADQIVARAASLVEAGSTPELKRAIGDFAKQLQSLFNQCKTIHENSVQLDTLDKEIESNLSAGEGTLSRKIISMGQQGKDVSMLEQIGMLFFGYRETMLKISLIRTRMSAKHPESFDSRDGDQLISLLNDLKLKLRTLTASEPFIAEYGKRLTRSVTEYETATTSYLHSMDALMASLDHVKSTKKGVVRAMKEADRNISLTAGRMKENIADVMHSSSIFILITSLTIICLVIFTLRFSYRDFRQPMGIILEGIESIRGGDLDTSIKMKRHDEWGDIEDAMNMMVGDLKRSYSELTEKNMELEITQSELETKVAELELEMTERQRAENALSESEQRLYSTIQGSPIPIFVIDREMKVVYWNRALEHLSGIKADEVIGSDRAWAALYKNEQPLLAGLLVKGNEAELPRWYGDKFRHSRLAEDAYEVTDFFPDLGNGGRWLHITAALLRDSRGEVIGAIETLEDISERRHLEDQLRQSQKMEAIGQLAGGVAHDFNNLLTAIMGFGNLLQLRIGDDKRNRKYVDQIVSSAEKGAKLTHSLLAFSRKHVVELKTASLNEIIVHARNLLTRLVREDIELRIATGEDCLIRADSMQIEQVIMNLVTNARDAMQDGGILTIKTDRFMIGEDFVRRHGYGETGPCALISVSDTGVGMDEATRERIFEPFFTSKAAGKGTGLGLSIVYGIIKQHNGFISVQSETGKGTTFSIYLPIVREQVDRIETGEEALSLPQGSETVLLADDDPIVRELTKELLNEFGYTVIEAEDGDDAVEKFLANRDEIRLAILDAIMPKKNGMEVYNEIRSHQTGIKALFISGYTGDVLNRKGILDKELDIIQKPFVQSAILRKVRELLDG